MINSSANFQMTKNTSFLHFSFVINDLIAFDNACNSFCSGRQNSVAVKISAHFRTCGPTQKVCIRPRGRVLYQSKFWLLSFSTLNWHLSCLSRRPLPTGKIRDQPTIFQLDCPGVTSGFPARRISARYRERTRSTRSVRAEIQRRRGVAQ